jgi:hypothetical protein
LGRVFTRSWLILASLALLLGLAVTRVSASTLTPDQAHAVTDPADAPQDGADDSAAAEESGEQEASIADFTGGFEHHLPFAGLHGGDEMLYEPPHVEPSTPPIL